MPVSSKEFLEIQATIECRITLKRVRDMIITYSPGEMLQTIQTNEWSKVFNTVEGCYFIIFKSLLKK